MDDATGKSACPHVADSIGGMCSAHKPIEANTLFPVGTIFGDWRLTAFIGRGGNGEVYCAEHATLGTPAAVKVLMRDDERAKVRFAREAKLLATLKSTAFPRFFAYGEANGTVYLAMELLEPGELPTGDRAVAAFMLKVCDAVGELHALGYVHRDIKPGNILWRRVEDNAPCQAGPRIGRAACPHAAASTIQSLNPNKTFTAEHMKSPVAMTFRAELRSATMPFRNRPTPYTMPPAVRNAPS